MGRGLLRPIHDRQLREAAEGLAACSMHKVIAGSSISSSLSSLPSSLCTGVFVAVPIASWFVAYVNPEPRQ